MQEQIFISGPQEEALAFGRKGEEVSRVQTLVRLCPGKPVLGSFPLPTLQGTAHDSYEATLKKKENQVGFKALHRGKKLFHLKESASLLYSFPLLKQ